MVKFKEEEIVELATELKTVAIDLKHYHNLESEFAYRVENVQNKLLQKLDQDSEVLIEVNPKL